MVNKWPSSIYLIPPLLNTLAPSLLNASNKTTHGKALLKLATDLNFKLKQYDLSLIYGLKLVKKNQLDLVEDHNLYSCIEKNCALVMQYDAEILESMDVFPKAPDSMIFDVQNDSPSQETLRIRSLVGSQGVQLLVNNSDRIQVLIKKFI